MSSPVPVGELCKTREETEVEWKIPDFCLRSKGVLQSLTFSFMNAVWRLQIMAHASSFQDWTVYLAKVDSGPLTTVKCAFGVRCCDNTVRMLSSNVCTFGNYHTKHHVVISIEKFEWMRRQSESFDILTIVCVLKPDSKYVDESISNPTKLIDLETLSENFKHLLVSSKNCDTTLKVMDRDFHVHKAVLTARSPVLAAMFEHDMSEKETGIASILDCNPDTFGDFLQYLYTGKIENMSFSTAVHLHSASHKYDVKELKVFCVKIMMCNLTVENVNEAVSLADQYEETKLLSASQEFFNQNVAKIVLTSEWETLMRTNYRLANKLIIEMTSKMKIRS